MKSTVKKIAQIPKNITSETPKQDKRKRNIALIAAGVGFAGRIVLAFTPAAPVALASLASELMWAGFGGLGIAGYFQNKTVKK